MLPPSVAEWRDGGTLMDTSAGRVFVRSAPGEGPTILLLHGYPSSSYDYHQAVRHLDGRAWLTLDFLGFGLSDKPRPHRYSLLEQADIVEAVVAQAASGPMVLVAHDMGTSVATELLSRDMQGQLPFELQRAVIGNGSVILNRASLRPAQKLLRGPLGPILSRLSNESSFVRGFGRLFSADHPLTEQEGRAQWALWSQNDGHRIAHLLISYLDERVSYAGRWHGAVGGWPKPLSFLWALDDPVATANVLEGLRELRPAATVVELPGVGHYPQVEVPDEFMRAALRLLSTAH